jgi:hypothetical protein
MYKRASENMPLTLVLENSLPLSFLQNLSSLFYLQVLVYPPLIALSRLDPPTWDFYAFFFLLAAALPLSSLCPSDPLSSTSFELTSRESSPLSPGIFRV